MKVFAWVGHGRDNYRCIVAAPSKAAAARAAGYKSPARMWDIYETPSEDEKRIALASPGTVFIEQGSGSSRTYKERGDLWLYGSEAPTGEGGK